MHTPLQQSVLSSNNCTITFRVPSETSLVLRVSSPLIGSWFYDRCFRICLCVSLFPFVSLLYVPCSFSVSLCQFPHVVIRAETVTLPTNPHFSTLDYVGEGGHTLNLGPFRDSSSSKFLKDLFFFYFKSLEEERTVDCVPRVPTRVEGVRVWCGRGRHRCLLTPVNGPPLQEAKG